MSILPNPGLSVTLLLQLVFLGYSHLCLIALHVNDDVECLGVGLVISNVL